MHPGRPSVFGPDRQSSCSSSRWRLWPERRRRPSRPQSRRVAAGRRRSGRPGAPGAGGAAGGRRPVLLDLVAGRPADRRGDGPLDRPAASADLARPRRRRGVPLMGADAGRHRRDAAAVASRSHPTRTIYDVRQRARPGHTQRSSRRRCPRTSTCSRGRSPTSPGTVASADGKPHQVQVYFDCGAEIAVNTPDQSVGLDYPAVEGLAVARMGTADQPVLARKGDDVRIDWGYGYLATPAGAGRGRHRRQRRPAAPRVHDGGQRLPLRPGRLRPRRSPSRASRWPRRGTSATVGATPVSRWPMLAYDDVYSIQYFTKNLRPYWRRNGVTIGAAARHGRARTRRRSTRRRATFDAELMTDLTQAGGAKYAAICALAYRQRWRPQVRRRRQRPAAAVPQGELQQRLHRHGGRDLPDGAAVPAVRPVADQGVAGAVPELRQLAALEVPLRAARPRHLSARQRPGLRRRRADGGEPDAGRGDRQHAHPGGRPRADGGQRGLRRPLLAACSRSGPSTSRTRASTPRTSSAPTTSPATSPTTSTCRPRRSSASARSPSSCEMRGEKARGRRVPQAGARSSPRAG